MQVAPLKLILQHLLSIFEIFSISERLYFSFILGDICSAFLLWILVFVLQMPEITLAIYVSLHVMCLLFLSSINRKVNCFIKNENPQYGIP
jgi:hypothetical protein